MFVGLMTLECQGGSASASAGSPTRTKLQRRPGYMRTEQARSQSASAGGPGANTSLLIHGASNGCHDIIPGPTDMATTKLLPLNHKLNPVRCQPNLLSSSLPTPPLSHEGSGVARRLPSLQSDLEPRRDLGLTPRSACLRSKPTPSGETFNSSFSFIQQSLTSSPGTHPATVERCPLLDPPPLDHSSPKTSPSAPGFVLPEPPCPLGSKTPGGGISGQTTATPVQSDPSQSELSLGERLWQDRHWEGREGAGGRGCASVTSVTSDLRESLADSDSCSLDAAEAASSLSVDSDAGSASSVTSGYDSATPICEQSQAGSWGVLVKRYEGVLQDCLESNRANTKIESMMLKLQRLQQKAILDDDYDTAERCGEQLEELRGQRLSLRLGLPSREPSVATFLQRLTQAAHSALRRTESNCRAGQSADGGKGPDSVPSRLQRRDHLMQEKHLVEVEMQQLQARLEELQERGRSLDQQIRLQGALSEQGAEPEEAERAALHGYSPAQLRELSQSLEHLVTCQSRTQMCVAPPASLLRLQEQDQLLSQSIKETTAKVVMSQRLGASLRRKVSETETQLLALHEAKLAAIAGSDFGSAKELKAEMRSACAERERLERLARRLHGLSSGNSQDLARTKDSQTQLRAELDQRQALHERSLKEHAVKYIELLEDRLHSCGCPALERVCEADLEACHLFLRGLQLRTPSLGGPDAEDPPALVVQSAAQPCTKEEEDCAMLTALGGQWCPEANLQNSEFTKKLEEFLFCVEDHHPEDSCSEAVDLTERCELISDRLMTLEEDLQTAITNRDQALAQCLEKEVGEVKAALQSMLAQLGDEEAEEEEDHRREEEEETDCEILTHGMEGEEEDEDQYFSDSWEI